MLACENIRFSSLFAAGDVSRNVPSGEERGETDVLAGYYHADIPHFPLLLEILPDVSHRILLF